MDCYIAQQNIITVEKKLTNAAEAVIQYWNSIKNIKTRKKPDIPHTDYDGGFQTNSKVMTLRYTPPGSMFLLECSMIHRCKVRDNVKILLLPQSAPNIIPLHDQYYCTIIDNAQYYCISDTNIVHTVQVLNENCAHLKLRDIE